MARRLALLAALLLAWLPTPAPADEPPLTVLLDDNYPPYIFRDDQGRLQGILKDLWELWAERTGQPVRLLGLDWAEAQAQFNAGQGDVLDTLFRNPAREKIYDFSAPYVTIEVPIVFEAGLAGIADVASLKGFSVGVKAGDACVDVLTAGGIDSFKPYPSYETMVTAAGRGELKVMCIDKPPAIHFLSRQGLGGRFLATHPLYSGQFHWAVRKGEDATYQRVRQGFDKIGKAERQAVEARWLGSGLTSGETESWRKRALSWAAMAATAGLALAAWVWLLRRQVQARTAQLSSALSKLELSEQRFRTIFDNITDALFVHDVETGQLLLVNRRMTEMYRLGDRDWRTLQVDDCSEGMPPYSHAEAMEWIARSAERPQCFEWHARRLDGSLFWVEVSMRRAIIDDGPERLLVVVRDIDERKQAQDQLTRTIDALSRSNTDLERFAYAASHDLREPLNTVIRFAQLLETRYGPKLGDDGREVIEFVVRGAKQMVALVDGLLDYSRVNATTDHFERVSLDKVMAVVRDNLKAAIEDSGATLSIPALPVVTGDEIQLIQLFQNLIGNAIKYRQPGKPPAITLACWAEGLSWRFSLTDDGIGIAPEFRAQVFTIFKRLHTQNTIPGVGMGLAMCKRIVERHGGRIWVDEAPGGGAAFHFSLNQ